LFIFIQLKKVYLILFLLLLQFDSQAQVVTNNETGTQLKFIKTYPNPATTEVTLAFQKGYNRNYSIQILNSIGKKMYMAKQLPTSFTIDLRSEKFYRGIYIYQLLDMTGVVIESGKILVVN
jgi:Secretion system C-terminal sorting domain